MGTRFPSLVDRSRRFIPYALSHGSGGSGGGGSDWDLSANNTLVLTHNSSGVITDPQAVLTADLYAAWLMDETSGTRADSVGDIDLYSWNNVGSTTGKDGKAARTLAADDSVLYHPGGLGFSSGNFYVSAWLYLENTDNSQKWLIGDSITGGDGRWFLFYYPISDVYRFHMAGNSSSTTVSFSIDDADSTGTWTFLEFYYKPNDFEIGIAVNGSEFQTKTHNYGFNSAEGEYFLVGSSDARATTIDTRVDLLYIWRRILTSEERSIIYNSGNGINLFS